MSAKKFFKGVAIWEGLVLTTMIEWIGKPFGKTCKWRNKLLDEYVDNYW